MSGGGSSRASALADAAHLELDRLSALLDAELSGPERSLAERHLAACVSCRERFEGLRRTARLLATSAWEEPPADLDLAVARRIALERDRPTRWERFEGALDVVRGPSPWLGVFAVIIALGVVFYLLAHAAARGPAPGGTTTVVALPAAGSSPTAAEQPVGSPASVASPPQLPVPTVPGAADLPSTPGQRQVAGRVLAAGANGWVEVGLVESTPVAVELPCSRRELWPADAGELAPACALDRPARLRLGDRVVVVLPGT